MVSRIPQKRIIPQKMVSRLNYAWKTEHLCQVKFFHELQYFASCRWDVHDGSGSGSKAWGLLDIIWSSHQLEEKLSNMEKIKTRYYLVVALYAFCQLINSMEP